jgi:hypothetical protein
VKSYIAILFLLAGTTAALAQGYSGKGDQKFQVGANLQDNGTGITASYDYGLGENISIGAISSYTLGINNSLDTGARKRFDAKSTVLTVETDVTRLVGLISCQTRAMIEGGGQSSRGSVA